MIVQTVWLQYQWSYRNEIECIPHKSFACHVWLCLSVLSTHPRRSQVQDRGSVIVGTPQHTYRRVSNMRRAKYQRLNASRLVL